MIFSKTHKDFPLQVYSTVFPLYLISTLLGLFPLNSKNHNGRRQIYYSKFQVVRTVFIAALYMSVVYYVVHTFESVQGILCKVRFYQNVLSVLLYLSEITMACVYAEMMAHIFKNIDKADGMFRNLKIEFTYKRIYFEIIIYIIVVFMGVGIILLLLVTTESFLICYSCRMHNILVEIITYCLPLVANSLTVLQYFQYLNILRSRYEKLNRYLLKNGKLLPSQIGLELISVVSKANSKLVAQTEETGFLQTVNQITKIHILLTDTAHMVNKMFCTQQLFKLTITFVSIISAMFLFAMVFAVKDPSRLQMDTLFFIWTFSNIIDMFIIVWISAETCKEANDCPIILHRIRNTTTNEKLKCLIDLHSLRMYHSKLVFNVWGLFSLDYSLIYSVIAGATTYLVILIQFNMDMVRVFNNQTA